jgi:uncharacterized protein YndB with AHSA1/START domain
MTEYRFVTRWRLAAPREAVWQRLVDPDAWPRWWRGVEKVELLAAGDASGLGSLRRYTFRSRLPYRLAFDMRTTRVEPPAALEGEASGELVGTGRWELSEDGDGTRVVYHWNVRTAKRWMNLLAPLLRPAFAWNHDVIMRWGGEGLAGQLGCAFRDPSKEER